MMLRTIIALCLALATPVAAQNWADVGPVLIRDLTGGRMPLQTHFFPDTSDPTTASRAVAVAYVHIEGSAGSASIHAGLFERRDGA